MLCWCLFEVIPAERAESSWPWFKVLYLKGRAEKIYTDLSLSMFNKYSSLFIKHFIRHSDGWRVIINTSFCLCSLLFTKVKLETLCRGPEEALLSCKRMLQIWKSCYNLTNPRYIHTPAVDTWMLEAQVSALTITHKTAQHVSLTVRSSPHLH